MIDIYRADRIVHQSPTLRLEQTNARVVLAFDHEREVLALRALIPYAWHRVGCKYAQWDHETTPRLNCSCGFDAARAAVTVDGART